MSPSFYRCLVLIASFLVSISVCYAEIIWIEAENTTETSVTENQTYNNADTALLSGGKWVSHFGPSKGSASYSFYSKGSAPYRLWLRINPKNSSIRFKLNDKQWQRILSFKNTYDEINVASDKKADYRYLAWADIGQHQLVNGVNKIHFEFDSENNNHGALDCFCFSTDPHYRPNRAAQTLRAKPRFNTPYVDENSFDDWIKFIEPSPEELIWRTHIRWHTSFADAVKEASRLRRPILLWTMNGHPCGET